MTFLAKVHFNDALKSAIKTLEAYMKGCSELTVKDCKLSDKAKEYFAAQEEEAREAIALLRKELK